MGYSRRTILAAGGMGTLALTAGCLEFARGDGPLEFTAARAAPTEDVLAATGYEEDQIEEESFDETVEFGLERDVRASMWLGTYTKDASIDGAVADAGESEDGDQSADEDVADDELSEDEDVPDGIDVDDLPDDLTADDHDALEGATGDMDPRAEFDASNTFAVVSTPAIEYVGQSFNPLQEMTTEEILEEFLEAATGGVDDLEHEEEANLDVLGAGRDVDRYRGDLETDAADVEVLLSVASFEHEDDYLVLLGAHPAMFEEETENVDQLLESVEHPL